VPATIRDRIEKERVRAMSDFLTWQIGDVKITRIQEAEESGMSWVLDEAIPENLRPIEWLAPHFIDAAGEARWSIHAFVVEVGSRKIVVDTCVGNDKNLPVAFWNKLSTSFMADFERAGFRREEIDTVLCTHLHVDHVGWNTMLVDGAWIPTFPNARYLVARDEWNHWRGEDDEFTRVVFAESVDPIEKAGLIDVVDQDARVCDEIRLEPTPGHTPGHVSIHIESKGEKAVITGDQTHHPCQLARPEWGSKADSDFEQAVETRRVFYARHEAAATLVIGTHFATPTAGRIERDGEVYKLVV
jgi:glyoxylase-like metal-dependent hydrolase (beta-lactamase superfamily II)